MPNALGLHPAIVAAYTTVNQTLMSGIADERQQDLLLLEAAPPDNMGGGGGGGRSLMPNARDADDVDADADDDNDDVGAVCV